MFLPRRRHERDVREQISTGNGYVSISNLAVLWSINTISVLNWIVGQKKNRIHIKGSWWWYTYVPMTRVSDFRSLAKSGKIRNSSSSYLQQETNLIKHVEGENIGYIECTVNNFEFYLWGNRVIRLVAHSYISSLKARFDVHPAQQILITEGLLYGL